MEFGRKHQSPTGKLWCASVFEKMGTSVEGRAESVGEVSDDLPPSNSH
jgi:hypothetical protein